jgi:hypothetical protein
MKFQKIWVDQCRATKGIKRRFGIATAMDYLVGDKLVKFAQEADSHAEFARELPRFLAAIWQIFNQYELAGYLSMQKPADRKRLRALLFVE